MGMLSGGLYEDYNDPRIEDFYSLPLQERERINEEAAAEKAAHEQEMRLLRQREEEDKAQRAAERAAYRAKIAAQKAAIEFQSTQKERVPFTWNPLKKEEKM